MSDLRVLSKFPTGNPGASNVTIRAKFRPLRIRHLWWRFYWREQP